MKIYTKTGDRGETSLLGGDRVRKDSIRVSAYGDVDEANSAIGLAVSLLGDADMCDRLSRIQADLLALGATLATGDRATEARRTANPPLPLERVGDREVWMDEMDAKLPALTDFVLPGGHPASAALHVARTVTRRAERSVISLCEEVDVDPGVLAYLNRLSDLLFVMARTANAEAGGSDAKWTKQT
jgi:cob(I)alamin adenosyltransferase